MQNWKKLSPKEIKKRVFKALGENVDYYDQNILGVPASHLDSKVFYQDAPFLKDAPFISTMVHNPNHIGCHTLGESEHFFKGTQDIEREVIGICAVDILNGKPGEQDGYVASGGTEANMQAIWIYRNYFIEKYSADISEICILCSADAHYSMPKAANVFNVEYKSIPVNETTRQADKEILVAIIDELKKAGKKYFIVVVNMMTTMFGSVDDVDGCTHILDEMDCIYKLHVDGAYGGFFYPFSENNNRLDFSNPKVTSITLDAHKMAQAPYGTGIFLIRKNYLQYANTKEASYVEGEDTTLIGSRSGANAVAIWMILSSYGPYGWKEKIFILLKRTDWLCEQLKKENIGFYRHPKSNIVTIKSKYVSSEIANEFGLVPDNHHRPKWYKIVVMEHVHIENLIPLIEKLKTF
ncbi:MAG TPA: aspartate aminotransferase family protein [Bacteroidetes bacterium]|nr:aspartate aminotransferase family protein [Bacteroidota bacterium]